MTGSKVSPWPRASSSMRSRARWTWTGSLGPMSAPLPQEGLDRFHDAVLAVDLAGHQRLALVEVLLQVLDELAAAVGTFHLAVGELVDHRKQGFAEDLHADLRVASSPV